MSVYRVVQWLYETVIVPLRKWLWPGEECAVLEIDEADGRRMWGVSSNARPYRRRYFCVSSHEELAERVRQCAHLHGLPQVGAPHPRETTVVEEITIRLDELSDVWQAMVTYKD